MDWPKVSVITPSFNQAKFIEATLESIWNQGYPNLEHIVIDGGSTDGTVDILRRNADRFAYWVSEKDEGQTDALIKGFSKATGDILCWLNSDDVFEPGALKDVASFFVRNPQANVVYGNATWISADGQFIKPKKEHAFNRFIWMYDYNYIPQPSTFWRKRVYEQVGGLNKSFDLAMDADLWARFAERTEIYHVNRTWSRMRLYAEQKNQRLRAKSDLEDDVIRRRYLGDEPAWSRRCKGVLAKGIRVSWKLVRGCYW